MSLLGHRSYVLSLRKSNRSSIDVFQDQRQSTVAVDMYINAVNPDVNPELSLM